jgi:exosortase
VQHLATAQSAADSSAASKKNVSARLVVVVLFLALLWFVLCRQLSGEWSVNEQYSFGWFVPFFALYLFWLRWQDRPAAQISNRLQRTRNDGHAFQSHISTSAAIAIASVALVLLLPVRLFEIANPEWRLLAWVHAMAVVSLTLFVIWCVGGRAWLRHFAFPVVFILIAVPWPTMVETPIIQGLMRVVASVAAEMAMLFGIPAQVEGNLIRVSNGLVGVNEACSGIRSLQTSLMIGLLFGELKRLSIGRRVALIVGAVAIALFANFVRAVFLVVVAATKNISEVSRWHDVAGYTIIALVFVGTMALAYLLGKSEIRNPKREIRGQGSRSAIPTVYLAAAVCWLLLVEIGSAAWYRTHERNLVTGTSWSVEWPERAPNFRALKIDEEIRSVLRFDEGYAAAWTSTSSLKSENFPEPRASGAPVDRSGPNTISCFLYLFRWKPGRNSALLANLHRPDVCLPASGWAQVADNGVRNYPVADGFQLPFRHFEFQRRFENSARQIAHAFYCLSEDRAAGASASRQDINAARNSPGMYGSRSEWTRAERLGAVLEGRRHLGQQVMEIIFVSSERFSGADTESYLRDLVRDIVVLRRSEK